MGNLSSHVSLMHDALREADLPLDLTDAEREQTTSVAEELPKEQERRVSVFKTKEEYAKITCTKADSQLMANILKVYVLPLLVQHVYHKGALEYGKAAFVYGRTGMRKLGGVFSFLSSCKYTTILVGQYNAEFFEESLRELREEAPKDTKFAVVFNKVMLNNPNGVAEKGLLRLLQYLKHNKEDDTKVIICMDECPRNSQILPSVMELVDTEIFAPTPNRPAREQHMVKRLHEISESTKLENWDKKDYVPKLTIDLREALTDTNWIFDISSISEGCTFEEMDNFFLSCIDQEIKNRFSEAIINKKDGGSVIDIDKNSFLDRLYSYNSHTMERKYRLSKFDSESEASIFNNYYKSSRNSELEMQTRREEREDREKKLALKNKVINQNKEARVLSPSIEIKKKNTSTRRLRQPKKIH
jgi:hypothetical protein